MKPNDLLQTKQIPPSLMNEYDVNFVNITEILSFISLILLK